MSQTDEQSDDEIFFGKLTFKEIKKHVFMNNPGPNLENKGQIKIKSEPDTSINIIETHSQPNLRAVKEEKATFYSTPGSPALNRESVDDSFIQLENMVSELCVAPRTSDNIELNNTLEVIDYILNNGPKHKIEHLSPNKENENSEKSLSNIQKNNIDEDKKELLSHHYTLKEIGPIEQEKAPCKNVEIKHENKEQVQKEIGPIEPEKTPHTDIEIKHVNNHKVQKQIGPKEQEKLLHKDTKIQAQDEPKNSEQYFTPVKNAKKMEDFATPSSSNVKLKTPVFKTPAPLSNKKTVTSAKKTPSRINPYQHIASPIASYINNCPQAPLIKDVHPKKPLPGPSSIPKFVKSQPIKSQLHNKENIDLPKLAYKSAKKTVLIDVDEEKLPQSQWVKSTLPRPKVLKHEKREINPLKARAKQEESFANLSCLQAEVSVCTQKTAFKSNK